MRKSLLLIFSISFILIFSSCSDTLNTSFPEASSTLAVVSGVAVTTVPQTTTSSTSTSTSATNYATVSGEFENGRDYDIYYFYTSSGNNKYTFSWTNGNGAEAAVSISDYSSFVKCHYSNAIKSPISYTSDESDKLYIKVKPRYGDTSYAGRYSLTVTNGSVPVILTKDDSYRY